MENVSKALIVAGAILISFLIIGLGVLIYNMVANNDSKSKLDQEAIIVHNTPFTDYFGEFVSGSNVKALISRIQTNNNTAAAKGEKEGYYIYIVGKDGETITPLSIDVKFNYFVGYPEDNEYYTDLNPDEAGPRFWSNGYIRTILIYENFIPL